jgi:hypothetical protein
MALVVYDRIQQTGTANTTVSFTLSATTTGYQSFAAVGNGNTTYYSANDGTNWEVGIGTYSTTGPTLTRTTILSSSNSGSAVTFTGTVTVFCDYPAGKAVFKDSNNNISWQNEAPGYTNTVTAAGTTILTVASTYYQHFSGSTTQTLQMPNATTCPLGMAYLIDNDSSGTVTITNNSGSTLYTVPSGCAGYMYLLDNTTTNGSWAGYSFIPGAGPSGEAYWSTSGPNLGGGTISNGSWGGSAIGAGFGGTGLSSVTVNQIPYGNGTNPLSTSSSFTFDGTTQSAPIQAASNGLHINSNTVSTSFSIPSSYNAMAVGPITVAAGQSVTVPSGSRWVVL